MKKKRKKRHYARNFRINENTRLRAIASFIAKGTGKKNWTIEWDEQGQELTEVGKMKLKKMKKVAWLRAIDAPAI